MKKSDDKFEWTEEADTAFAQLKKVLSTPPVLVAPNKKEPLLLYIATTHQVVSTVLVVERSEEGKAHGVQRPVFLSAKYYLQQNKGTRTIKSLHTVYSQQHENYGNISWCTQL
jgi:dsDNA-binding SOS-regulon protein